METLVAIIVFLVKTFGSLYLMVVLLRLMLQIARADFYNPLSQAVVKATNPLLLPLRKVIPGIMGIDFASIVLALLVALVTVQGIILLKGFGFLNPLYLLAWSAVIVLSSLASLLFWALIILVIASFVAPQSYHPALLLIRQLMQPIMNPIQRIIPPMGGLDFSPLVVIIILQIISNFLIPEFAMQLGMPRWLFLGF
ncbi:YggT family protein [Simiduia sp. 21SJ11W-1]|uniref:YggT family protein n=1 Tax=Simiduia sp. 21SJ11W-1 TaxID=2909669 RepID=UPI00209CFFC4|nr:YggT family protein [Simiduia sp. 21SJ11W-1]UTA48220.1 YggT family protein [Simiduia sp. 21SJ11W-1]